MDKHLKERVDNAARFYTDDILRVDYKQAEFCYRSFLPFFRGTTALELGPSTGYMTRLLVNDFDHLQLVEGAGELLAKIPDYPNTVKHHSLFEQFEPDRRFDTVIMNHVLEHIESPVALLERISTWMEPDGVLIIGVPNALSFHRMAAVKMGLLSAENELNERDHALGHFRVYDKALLTEHLEAAGLTIEYFGGIFVKFMSNAQIEQTFNDEMLEAYYEVGKDFPENCAEIFAVCRISTGN